MTIWHNQFVRIKPANSLKIFLFAFFVTTYVLLLSFYVSHRDQTYTAVSPVTLAEPAKSTEKVIRVIDGYTFEIECVLQGPGPPGK